MPSSDVPITISLSLLVFISLAQSLELRLLNLPEPWRSLTVAFVTVGAAFYFLAKLLARSTPNASARDVTDVTVVGAALIVWATLAFLIVQDCGAHNDEAVTLGVTSVFGGLVGLVLCLCKSGQSTGFSEV